jgi:hypothetical protein
MQHESSHLREAEPSREDRELVDRYDFRHRIKTLLELLDNSRSTLPNRETTRGLLLSCLSLVPAVSKREEEWLDHELSIERGDIVGGSPEDKDWVKRNPRFPPL